MAELSTKYLDPQTLASLESLGLQARTIVEGYIAGLHRSPYHGFSVEFAEHREYVPGDDIRHVDWKAWSKTDKLYLKQYEEETNLITQVALDTSASMSYASPEQGEVTKLLYGQWIAASLSYLVLSQHDSIGLSLFDSQLRRYVRPSGQPSQLKEILNILDGTPCRFESDLATSLKSLAERIRKRSVVAIISDLFDDPEQILQGLKTFRHRRHEVIVFHVLDPAEVDFPFRDPTLFQGLEVPAELMTDPSAFRDAYQEVVNDFIEALRRGCRMIDIDYVPMRTDQPLDAALSTYLAARSGRMLRRRG